MSARVVVPGLHHWPAAPDRRAYLRSPHRHLFHVTVTVAVADPDRAVEFHDLQDAIHVGLSTMTAPYHVDTPLPDFGARSCETIARDLGVLLDSHEVTVVRVEVSEDGENTSTWWREP